MSEIEELKARVARLEAELERREAQAEVPDESFSRRHLIRMTGAAIAGAGAAALSGAAPAAADNGDNLVAGGIQLASQRTILYTDKEGALADHLDRGFISETSGGILGPSIAGLSSGAGVGVYGYTTGTAAAVQGDISNATTSANAILGQTNGNGAAVQGTTTGTGAAVQGDISNANTLSSAVLGRTNGKAAAVLGSTSGTGPAVQGDVSNGGTIAAAVQGNTNGSGAAVLGDTTGAGPALHGRSTGGYPTLVVENSGTGSQLYVVPKSAAGPPAPGSKGQVHLDANGDLFLCKLGSASQAVWVRPGFNPLSPIRICDTRAGEVPLDGPKGKRFNGTNTQFVIPGRAGIPSAGATAVMMNVTAVNAESSGFYSVYPGPTPITTATFSNLNFYVRQDSVGIPNLVVSKIGSDGSIFVFCRGGPVDLIIDVLGFFA